MQRMVSKNTLGSVRPPGAFTRGAQGDANIIIAVWVQSNRNRDAYYGD